MSEGLSPAQQVIGSFLHLYPGQAARTLETGLPVDAAQILARQAPDTAAEVIWRMQPDSAAQVLAAFEDDVAAPILTALDPAYASHLLARLGDVDRARILGLASPLLADEIRQILSYPPGTAGQLMEASVSAFPGATPVRLALERIRGLRNRRITDLVIVDEQGEFDGIVRLQDLVGAAPEQPLEELKRPRAVHVQPMASREEVVELLTEHHLASLPVVDLQNRIVGIIRHAGLIEATQANAAADLQQMVGGSREERALSKPWVGIRGRLPWLHINLVTAFLAASVVGLFEDTIAQFTALAILLPVVAGQSGNAGAQALAVTMRGLALREIRTSHAPRVMARELIVGFVNGLVIAMVTAAGVFVWSRNLGLALVMFLAMLGSMVAASAAGTAVPVVLVKLGRDPATASSIILTTVTDIVGFFSFLGLATVMGSMLAAG